MAQLVDRMIRAARLDPLLYEEVEADPGATGQAAAVVVISSLAAGVGSLLAGGGLGLLWGTLAALFAWLAWSLIVYLIGAKLLPEPQTEADLGQLLRTVGFSSAPGVLRLLSFIPLLGVIVQLVAGLWMLAAMVVAVRQALDYQGTGRAIVVCLLGWLAYLIFFGGFLSMVAARSFLL